MPVELLTIMSFPYIKSNDASKLEGAAITAKKTSLALACHLPAAGMFSTAVGQNAGFLECYQDYGRYCGVVQDSAGVTRAGD